jgi:hypothetical protein
VEADKTDMRKNTEFQHQMYGLVDSRTVPALYIDQEVLRNQYMVHTHNENAICACQMSTHFSIQEIWPHKCAVQVLEVLKEASLTFCGWCFECRDFAS